MYGQWDELKWIIVLCCVSSQGVLLFWKNHSKIRNDDYIMVPKLLWSQFDGYIFMQKYELVTKSLKNACSIILLVLNKMWYYYMQCWILVVHHSSITRVKTILEVKKTILCVHFIATLRLDPWFCAAFD